jgi:hypothetical protein
MRPGLDHIGQIAWHVADVDRAEAPARGRLACAGSIASAMSPSSEGAGVRLMIEKTQHPDNPEKSSVIYVGGAAIALAVGEHGKARLIAEARRSRSLEGVLRRPRRPQAGAYASSAERMRRRHPSARSLAGNCNRIRRARPIYRQPNALRRQTGDPGHPWRQAPSSVIVGAKPRDFACREPPSLASR